MGTYVGRGGLKLEAALERFGLAAQVQGALAIDVGSSTGGFVDCLLAHGARKVVAIDVGHGQLHPRLRDDPRVELHEGVHFKQAPLALAPGPHDFFTVDVSFAAARTMLRPLAFRLRPGAEGVVLVKPQFELPAGYVRGGQVRPEGLRAWALRRVVERGRGLGFELVQAEDSPVPGGEGTVEILAHLRFAGRGARMPAVRGEPATSATAGTGTRASTAAGTSAGTSRRPTSAGTATALQMFVVAGPGLEEVVEREVSELVGSGAERVEGGVELRGDRETLYRANLWLRTATRVLLRVGELRARDFASLVEGARKLPWERFARLGPDGAPAVEIQATAHRSRLYHTGAVAERIARAIAQRLDRRARQEVSGSGRAGPASPASPAGVERLRVLARGVSDRWVLSVDASGELLHRRGYREETARAPLRETLAAAVLRLSGWTGQAPLVDPMCGSGTFAIEAALLALDRAPGLLRGFAFEAWPEHRGEGERLLATLRDEARRRARAVLPEGLFLLAADRDARVLDRAGRNAERAGVAGHIQLVNAPLESLEVPPAPSGGWVVVNPPYGRLLSTGRAPREQTEALGAALRARFRGWRAAVLVPEAGLARALGGRLLEAHPLAHGGLRVTVAIVELTS